MIVIVASDCKALYDGGTYKTLRRNNGVMQTVTKLENMAAEWYKGMPHLPVNGRRWLSTNIWWIALVGVILGVLSVATVFFGTLLVGMFAATYGGVAGAALAGLGAFVVILSLLFSIVTMLLTAMAISPLKAKQKRGWTLIFITVLLQVAAAVVHLLFTFDIFGLIWNLLFTAIGAYFLFEVRDGFSTAKVAKTVSKK